MTAADASAGSDKSSALTHPHTADQTADPLCEPTTRVSAPWIAAITLANLGLFMAYFGPLGVLLPNQIQALAGPHRVVDFAWVTGAGAVVSMVVNPLAGALSDHTASRFGRR